MLSLNKRIYADTASATPLAREVERKMKPYSRESFGNPGSLHREGVFARDTLDQSKKEVADILSANPDEIIFTSGGTESNNLAITGIMRNFSDSDFRPHVLVTSTEHSSILQQENLADEFGVDWEVISVNRDGIVETKTLKEMLRPETVLVSIQYANNETGVVQDIPELRRVVRNFEKEHEGSEIIFHTDACQAPRFLDLSVNKLGVDLMTLNGGKIYGPKGVGCLYVSRDTKIAPIIFGGGQEGGLRSGTENTPGIVGFTRALSLCQNAREKNNAKIKKLRDELGKSIEKNINNFQFNGSIASRLPHNLNVSFSGVSSEELVLWMDTKGVAISSGSACGAQSRDDSYVIIAQGASRKVASEAVRITLDKNVTNGDIKKISYALIDSVKTIRESKKLQDKLK